MADKHETSAPGVAGEKALQVLRERRGGVPRELVEANRRQNAVRRKIVSALGEGPKTVPELAEAVDVPAHEVLWHVMGLKKYGKAQEAEQDGEYFKYMLIDDSRQTEQAS